MNGFLLVDKPPGPTSHDVVDTCRRALGLRRIGHAGTLDPPASGLVVVGVGPATRLLQYVQRLSKTYEAVGVLGVRTSTLDAAGEILSEAEVDVGRADLVAALPAFRGEIEQVPPAVSAVKVGGVRAYRRAARGEEVELQARRVHVYELEVTSFESPRFGVRVRCSSGTYIRSLVADIGDRLGCGAHVETLRRTCVGSIDVGEAVRPSDVAPDAVRPVASVLRDLAHVAVDADLEARARTGARLTLDAPEGDVLLVGPGGAVGVFSSAAGILRPVTVLGPG